jgi:hypothetical protein
VARQYTIDQTETDRFEIPTIPTPTLMDPPAPPAPFSSDLPNVRPHRHRKPTWGTVWAQEIGRRDFRIYIMVLAVLSGGILGGVLILRTPPTPSSSRVVVSTSATPTSPTSRPISDGPRLAPVAPVKPHHSHAAPTTPPIRHAASTAPSQPPVSHHPSSRPSTTHSSSPGPTKSTVSPPPSPSTKPTVTTKSSAPETPPAAPETPSPTGS